MFAKTLYPGILIFFLTNTAMAAGWQECRSQTDDQARLACYDAYADQLLEAGPRSVQTLEEKEADFGKRGTDVIQEELGEIQASIVTIQTRVDGRNVLTLDNGQVWRQLESKNRNTLREGDSITIERGALGSFKLKKVGSNRLIRVKRLK